MHDYASVGMVFFLFGIFCAWWAQESGRSTLVWFLMGWFFAPITGIVLLSKNRADINSGARGRMSSLLR